MLHRTFLHIRNVGPRRERTLWEKGVHSWDQAGLVEERGLGNWSRDVPAAAEQSRLRLNTRDALFFSQRLPAYERWRLYPEFKHETAFLDIETTWDGRLTVVGVLFRDEYRAFVRGRDLDFALARLKQAKLIVTYYGAGFDLPVIARALLGNSSLQPAASEPGLFKAAGGTHLPWAGHVDLCPILHRMGIKGGLKSSEAQLGILRPETIRDLRSEDAPGLWQEHLAGSTEALEILTAYNREDVVNLKTIIEKIIPGLSRRFAT